MSDGDRIRGCGTALVTPFTVDGELDEAAMARLLERQLQGGVDFLVPCGTTGESVTLSREERLRVVELTLEAASGQVPVVAGAGGYDTAAVVAEVAELEDRGVDGILSVSPYYNKPTQEGIFQHYRTIAEATSLPIVLYNVPGRTSSNIEPQTVARLAEIDNIVAVKEASGSIGQVAEVIAAVADGFAVLSGDDNITLPLMALGGVGVISVVSNEVPAEMAELVRLCLRGRFEEARRLHYRLLPLMKANFIESNPIPVKAALAMMGLIEEVYRLPLTPMRPDNKRKLRQILDSLGLLEEEPRAGAAAGS